LLLDRRRINKWARWVALFLAIVFAGGFLFLGVGYGGAGFNVSDAFSCSNQKTVDNPQTPKEKIAVYQAALDKNPSDTAALLGMATVYQQNDQLTVAAAYLEKVIAVEPSQKDVYIRLANIYLNAKVAQYGAAVTVLNKATSVDANNPDVYLKLGTAQNGLGQTGAAVLAWQKYLQLAPNGEMAKVVKEQIDKLSKEATTTTTAGSTTTTTAGSTTTTTAGPTTTATTQ
jgi:cytochrome c-type biogenesis protein CcmH/NrfG